MNAVAENPSPAQNTSRSRAKIFLRSSQARDLFAFCIFGAAYYLAYAYGMYFSQASASPFWFPDSILLCALLLIPYRRWWIFIFGVLPIRLFAPVSAGIPLWFLFTTFAIDSAKGILTAAALRRFIKNPRRLETPPELGVYFLFAVFLIPMFAGFAGASARQLLGDNFWRAWQQWVLGNATAHLVVTPAILYGIFGVRDFRLPPIKVCVEGVFLMICLLTTGYFAFGGGSYSIGFAENRFYAPMPFLFWAGIRFGMLGASAAIIAIASFAVHSALRHDAFVGISPSDTALILQHFLILRAAPVYLVAIFVEELHRTSAEIQRQRTEIALFARLSTMGQLAASLAHEINQPLGSILRNTEAAERILQNASPDHHELNAILLDIQRDDQRASAIIDRMRLFLKRHELDFEPLPLRQLIDQVMLLVRSEMLMRHVVIQLDVSPSLTVRGDRIQLEQVFLNLLVNSADAMADMPNGQRHILVEAVQCDRQTIEVAISDSGPGIPNAYVPHLFDPFFTTKSHGLGMGLPVSRTIIESHGGRIWTENKLKQGAVFRFTLQTAHSIGI